MEQNKNAVFTVEFDKDKFVENVSDAIKAGDKFEDKMDALSKSADKVNFTKPISQLHKFKEELASAFKANNGKLNLNDDQINKSVDNIVKSGPKIKEFLNALKKDLKKATDPEEFKLLRDSIKLTENALAELSGEEVKNEEASKSAKARLREMKQELIALEDAGLDDTEMFRKLTIEAAQLTDQLGDQAEQIRVLSSDTFALDAGVDILSQLAAGWQLTEGAMQLAGISTEETEAQMQKLVAIQSVMNGLQEIHAFLTGQSAGKLALLNGWNKAVAISTALVATVTGEATIATRAFSTALAATGIGAIVVALGLLIYKWEEIQDAITGASDATRLYEQANDAVTSSVAEANEEISKQKAIFQSAKDGVISKDKALKAYNDTFGDVLGTAKNYNEAERIFNSKTKDYIEAVQLRARAQELFKIAAQKSAEAMIEGQKSYSVGDKIEAAFTSLEDKAYNKRADLYKKGNIIQGFFYGIDAAARQNRNDDIIQKNKEAKVAQDLGTKEYEAYLKKAIDLDAKSKKDTSKKEKTTKDKKEVENIYKDLLSEFQANLKDVNNAELQGLSAINAEAEKNYQERLKKISEAQKDKKVTSKQAGDLRQIVGLIKNAEIQSETKKFNEERLIALDEANQQLQELQQEHQASLLDIQKEGYEKQLSSINFEESSKIKAYEEQRIERAKKIRELQDAEFLDEASARFKILELNNAIDQLITDAKVKANKERIEANVKYQQDLVNSFEEGRDLVLGYLKVEESDELLALNQKRVKGLITEEKYQEEKLKLQKDYAKKSKESRIVTINEEIAQLEQILSTSLDSDIQKNTADKINQLKTELNGLLVKENTAGPANLFEYIFGTEDEGKRKAEAVQKLVQQTIQTSIDLLKEQARLETEAYDRAIQLQQGRVDEARKIAEAGNSEYLQQETDRLNELEAKREASARRQLEIDQAVQASQILVAVAGAAAQIAKGGTVNVITGIASVIAAIGTGISLVNQMKSNAPKFYDGTEFVQLNGNPDGRDTIPAWVNKGERIVPTEINKQLKGIKNKDLPKLMSGELFYNHMVQVSEKDLNKNNDNADLRKEIQGLKQIQSEQLEYLKALKVSVNMDSEGFAASIETLSEKKKKMFNA